LEPEQQATTEVMDCSDGKPPQVLGKYRIYITEFSKSIHPSIPHSLIQAIYMYSKQERNTWLEKWHRIGTVWVRNTAHPITSKRG